MKTFLARPELTFGLPALLACLATLFAAPAFAAIELGGAGGLLSFFVYLVVVGLIFWAFWWFLSFVGLPEPFNKIARVVLGLFALIIVVNLLLGLVGSPLFSLR